MKDHFNRWRRDVTNFIWAGRKPGIKYKILIDVRECGGFQLPDLKIYYQVCCLLLQEWILLSKKKMLVLEGFNKTFGCHSYLMYGKVKADTSFKHHYIRNTLLQE